MNKKTIDEAMPVTRYAKLNGIPDRNARLYAKKLNLGTKEYGIRFITADEWQIIVNNINREPILTGVKKLAKEFNVSTSYIYQRLGFLKIPKKDEYTEDEKTAIIGSKNK